MLINGCFKNILHWNEWRFGPRNRPNNWIYRPLVYMHLYIYNLISVEVLHIYEVATSHLLLRSNCKINRRKMQILLKLTHFTRWQCTLIPPLNITHYHHKMYQSGVVLEWLEIQGLCFWILWRKIYPTSTTHHIHMLTRDATMRCQGNITAVYVIVIW